MVPVEECVQGERGHHLRAQPRTHQQLRQGIYSKHSSDTNFSLSLFSSFSALNRYQCLLFDRIQFLICHYKKKMISEQKRTIFIRFPVSITLSDRSSSLRNSSFKYPSIHHKEVKKVEKNHLFIYLHSTNAGCQMINFSLYLNIYSLYLNCLFYILHSTLA